MTTGKNDQTRLDDDPKAAALHVDLDLGDEDTDDVQDMPPFVVRLGGQTFTIEAPDGELVMELEEARTTRGMLSLIFDDQWQKASPLFAGIKPDKMTKLVRQYARHFEIDPETVATTSAPNRSERRRLRKQRR